jgi:hypothetical protein
MFIMKRRLLLFLLLIPLFLYAQGNFNRANPVTFIGLTLVELYTGLGVPKNVYSARGLEEWQDDVVFVFDEGDFYIYRNRVWQIGLQKAMGINIGDSAGVVSLLLGTRAETHGNSVFYPIHEGAWPMMMRCDIESGRVKAIFIYRTDF